MVLPGASYARISDNDGVGPGIGCADQHRRNGKRAVAEGITIAHELTDDDRSAYKEDVIRDNYQQLLDLIRADEVRYVLVKHADRLHRQPEQAEAFLKLARAKSVTVITATGMRYLFDTADGRRAFRDAANAASYESEHRSERIAESHERRALAGEYRGGAHRPFGWGVPTGVMRRVRDADGVSRDVEILDMCKHNQAEAAEMRRWAKELLSGVSANQVLNSMKLPTITGAPWSHLVMAQTLTFPRASGHSIYKGEIVKWNAWDPIIPEDQRQALITLFADPSRRTSPGNTPKWLGSLIFLCGVCDADPEATDPATYIMAVSGRSRGHQTYRCRRKNHCARQAVPLDRYVETVLVARLARDDIADLMPRNVGVDAEALRKQVDVLKQRKVQAGLVFAGDGDTEALAAVKADVDSQLSTIQAQLSMAAAVSPLAAFVGVNSIEEAALAWRDCTLGLQREILRTLATVTLMPVPRGTRTFSDDSVLIDWRHPQR